VLGLPQTTASTSDTRVKATPQRKKSKSKFSTALKCHILCELFDHHGVKITLPKSAMSNFFDLPAFPDHGVSGDDTAPSYGNATSPSFGRLQDVQVCPDPSNPRMAVCAGERNVKIYRVGGPKDKVLEYTLTGFTGTVLRCAWHFHIDERGNKTYLIASSCDDGRVLIHQQFFENVGADNVFGPPEFISTPWVVTFGGKASDAQTFSWSTTALAWMPAGALQSPDDTVGKTQQPFVLAVGSNKLTLVLGWQVSHDGGIVWKVRDQKPLKRSLIVALAWEPLQKLGNLRSLVAAVGTYDSSFELQQSRLMVFDFKYVSESASPDTPDYLQKRCTEIQVESQEFSGWIRDVAWSALPFARHSTIAVAFSQQLCLLIRDEASQYHFRRIQIFDTAETEPPKEFDLTTTTQNIWHLAWSRHGTMLAFTADASKTIVIRKVVAARTLPEPNRTLIKDTPVRIPGPNSSIAKEGAVVQTDSEGVQVKLDDGEVKKLKADQVQAADLVNIYDTLPGLGQVDPVVLRISSGGKRTDRTSGGLEMWEIVPHSSAEQFE